MKIAVIASMIFIASIGTTARPQQLTPVQALHLGRKYTAALYANDASVLWPPMTDQMKASITDETSLRLANEKVRARLGKETRMIKDVVMPNLQYLMYTRLAEFEKVPVKVVVTFTFSSEGKIAGFFVTPEQNPAESKYLDYKDKVKLIVPASGKWTVFQGGRTVFDNYHAAVPDERFAYDLMVIREGRQYSGKGTELSDFFSFGLPVLAPAAGKVLYVADRYDDNPVLMPSKDSPPEGNTIVIDHGNDEFSMLAHLQRGSIKVKVGNKVSPGQTIAAVGNSGNSPLPHLHFHLQTTPVWFKGEGLPIQFNNCLVNGKRAGSSEPSRGDVIANP